MGGKYLTKGKHTLSEEELEVLEQLCLFDDVFMSLVFEDNIDATEYLLNTILERDDLEVLEVTGQRMYKSPYIKGRSITMDIYAKDINNRFYDIEVQRGDAGAIPRRARYHSAMMDVRMLMKGQDFEEIEDSYVIFITQNDVMKKGLPIYHVDRIIKESHEEFGDGSHIVYVNGEYKNDQDEIGRLLHDFACTKAEDMYNNILKEHVRYYKNTEGGSDRMNEVLEKYIEKRVEARAQDLAQDMAQDMVKEKDLERIKNMVQTMKTTVEQAMDMLMIPAEERVEMRKRI